MAYTDSERRQIEVFMIKGQDDDFIFSLYPDCDADDLAWIRSRIELVGALIGKKIADVRTFREKTAEIKAFVEQSKLERDAGDKDAPAPASD